MNNTSNNKYPLLFKDQGEIEITEEGENNGLIHQ